MSEAHIATRNNENHLSNKVRTRFAFSVLGCYTHNQTSSAQKPRSFNGMRGFIRSATIQKMRL